MEELIRTIKPATCILVLMATTAVAKASLGYDPWEGPQIVAPSTSDHMALYRYACNGDYTPRVTSEQIISHYSALSNASVRLQALARSWDPERECRRELTAWRYLYIDEAHDKVLIRERSLDERLANVLYTTRALKPLSVDFFTYNWGDSRVDQDNMRRVAGPRVDDDKCGDELRIMLQLMADLAKRVTAIRDNTPDGAVTTSMANVSTLLTDRHISMAKVLDSFGHYDSGLLFGRLFAPGSYEQCIWNKLIQSRERKLDMRFCWAHLNTSRHLTGELRERQRSRFETPLDVLLTGICIPKSCHSKSFGKNRREIQELVSSQYQMPASIYVDPRVQVDSIYCLADEDSEFRALPWMGKLLIGFFLSWCALILLVSIYNRWWRWRGSRQRVPRERLMSSARPTDESESYLDHLDLGNSWRDFMGAYTDKSRIRAVQLDTLNVLKVFGCAFVVLGHTMALLLSHTMDEVRTLSNIEHEPAVTGILAGTVVVDTFFVITGILWSYFMLKRLNRAPRLEAPIHMPGNDNSNNHNLGHQAISMDQFASSKQVAVGEVPAVTIRQEAQPLNECADPGRRRQQASGDGWCKFASNWLMYSSVRYLKIVPLYVMAHWFKKYVFIFAGTGPFWDHGLNRLTTSGTCHFETPLTPFTFLAAYYPLSRQCIFQSWSVANDIFFAILAPPTIMLMNKRPKLAGYLSAVSCLVTLAFAQHGIAQVPPYVDEELREVRAFGFYRFFDEISHFYTAPHYRIFCFLAGVWAGYFVYVRQAELERGQASTKQQQQQRLGVNSCNSHATNVDRGEMSRPTSEPARPLTRIEWPQWMRGPATWISLGYIIAIPFVFAYGLDIKHLISPMHRLIYQQFLSTLRFMWSAANAILMMRMMTDWKDSTTMRLFASKFWQIFAKLNYAILLIHLDMVVYSIESAPSLPNSFTKWNFFNLGAGVYLICIPLGIFAHVVFENPINQLIRSWLPAR